jgi:hypothetical protein
MKFMVLHPGTMAKHAINAAQRMRRAGLMAMRLLIQNRMIACTWKRRKS